MTLDPAAQFGPEDGFQLVRPKVTERLALPASATGGKLTIMEITVQPGGLIAPEHVHTDEDESLFIIDGRVDARLGESDTNAEAGSSLFAPRGVQHTYWNATDAPLRMIMVVTPGNLDGYFEGLPALISAPEVHTLGERIAAHAADYGMKLRMDSVAELTQEHGLAPP